MPLSINDLTEFQFNVAFSPSNIGTYVDSLRFITNDLMSENFNIELIGEASSNLIIASDVKGVFAEGQIYEVINNIVLNEDDSLFLEPGVNYYLARALLFK